MLLRGIEGGKGKGTETGTEPGTEATELTADAFTVLTGGIAIHGATRTTAETSAAALTAAEVTPDPETATKVGSSTRTIATPAGIITATPSAEVPVERGTTTEPMALLLFLPPSLLQ